MLRRPTVLLLGPMLLACTSAPDADDPSDAPLPDRDVFVTEGLAPHAGSRAALRARLGEPESVVREVVPNRHVPDVQDTLLTVLYPEVIANLHKPGGGGELLSSVRVESNEHLRYGLIGESLSEIDAAFGAPDDASDSSLVYRCATCEGADDPVEILIRDGIVHAVRFNYYVD